MANLSADVRIDRLETRLAVRELATAYCIAADDRDMEGLRALFTADIHIASRDGKMSAKGIDTVMGMFDRLFLIRGPSFHWTHDVIVSFDDADPDRAFALVLAHAETTPDGRACIAGIRYRDTFRREQGVWKFSERLLQFLYYMPMNEFIARFPTKTRIGIYSEWSTADYPETLDCWQAWHALHPR